GSAETSTNFTVNRFRHVRCKDCGMVYVNPRLREEITHDLYQEEPYTEFYRIKLIPSIDYRRNVLGVRKYTELAAHFNRPGRVLDIGCGLGEVLSVFQEHGWDCTGIEFNPFAAGYAKEQFGLHVINKSIYDFDGTDRYDLIMLWGVLEHFYDPNMVLRKIHSLLEENGRLLIEVPSADSLLVRYYERTRRPVDRIIEGDRHIMLFSLRALTEMLGRAGFSPVNIRANGLDVSTLNRLEMNGILDLASVNTLQGLLDTSLQGDLLRGVFATERSA
ncbi:MAG: methyltransferase domain-containing protein, partial [Methanomicrobiales archaeon]|nr:methyltransferase domain-containing protein [Methanomicrobiales archaeon]